MSENITIYTLSGEVEKNPSGSVRMDPSTVGGGILSPYSSSQHEITRLNAVSTASDYYGEVFTAWNSKSGRSTNSTSSQYYTGTQMRQPSPAFDGYYAKNASQDPNSRFTKLVYTLNASETGSYWNSADGAQEGGYVEGLGRIVDANSIDTFQVNIPVDRNGKIRDIKVWVELVHRARDLGDTASGLKGVQMALVSPNVRGRGAYPIWNMPGAESFLYDANPNLSGADGIIGDAVSNRQPEIFASGAFVLWDGHANPTVNYARANLGLQGDWSEFDSDMDMRVVFSDNSQNLNPRSRINVFPSATDEAPHAATGLQSALISSTTGLKPINYYYSPSNYAMRNYSGTFNWNGPSVTVTGARVPWYVDPKLSNQALNETILGSPPPGWVTGEPNALFLPWDSGQVSSNTGTIFGVTYLSPTSYPAGTSQLSLSGSGISATIYVGDSVRIVNRLTTSIYHDAVVSALPYVYPPAITISPALSVAMPSASAIYLRSHVSMSQGVSYFAGRNFTAGYYLTVDWDSYMTVAWLDPTVLFASVGGGAIPPTGSIVKWNNRYFKTSRYLQNQYVQDGDGEFPPEGPFDMLFLDKPYMDVYSTSGNTPVYVTTATLPGDSPETSLSSTFNLNNRFGFSYTFVPPNKMILVGGWTGSNGGLNPLQPQTNAATNVVDVLTFGSSSIISAHRSGVISDAVADDGPKDKRGHGDLYSINIGPDYAATFYMLVGGGVTQTLAITQSAIQTYSTASVASVTWSAPYQYQYWREATYYDTGDTGGGGDWCVDPSTPVLMSPNTLTPIKDIKVGDKVWTRPEWDPTAELDYHLVEKIAKFSNLRNRITMNDGRSFVCSINHLLNVRGVWRRSDSIEVGEELQGDPGGIIKSVEYLGEGPVIQIIIPSARTYYGGNGCWHHNAAPQKP